jgi:phosphoserine phosphatase
VGDSFNDVDIAREAGFSVALNPKCEDLVKVCDAAIDADHLGVLLPFFPS